VKTHYELLGLEPTADADTIKKAFRREIARYHPDKVVHLGAEFQDMAATRAAELTVAYKTLTDAALRAEYDANLGAAPAPVAPPVAAPRDAPPPADPGFRPPTIDEIKTPAPRGNPARFASERADRDNILRRAIGARVRATVEELYGKVDTPSVRGFDLAMIPVAKPRFLGSAPPRVLVKVVDLADSAAIAEAWNAAGRARVHAGKSPVIVLVFSTRVADQAELSKGWDGVARQRKSPEAPDDLTVVVVNVADWSCRLPPNSSTAVQKLADKICA
jgi:hypothetical protein